MLGTAIRYEILELLGEGSHARVFKALRRDPASGLVQTVAAKILRSRTAVELWKREFESLVKVRSPFCVQVYSFERIQRRPALILEFVDGVSLFSLAQGTLLDSHDTEEILAQIECGIIDLYRYGVFHGDLSPHNILIDVEGRVRLLDFGLANCGEDSSRLTPDFASPERLGGGVANLASDMYSIGRIELFLAGRIGESDPTSSYLHPQPDKRVMRGLVSRTARLQALAKKVARRQEHLKRMQAISTRTQSVVRPSSQSNSWTAPLKRLLFLFVFALMTTSSASQKKDLPSGAWLHIHTRQWHRLSLDGKDLGYAPLAVAVEPGRGHVLRWSSPAGEGLKQIQLRAGQTANLTDRDFSH